MTIEKKNKLIYSGELLLFAIVFLVIGILELVRVINLSDRFQLIFKIITLVGATWISADFIWTLCSKRRRENYGLLDKIMLLPLAIYLYAYDIAGFVVARPYEYYQIGVPIAFFYLCCVYTFQGIYHYFNPIPLLLKAIEEEIAEKEKEKNQALEEAKPEEAKLEEVSEEAQKSNDTEDKLEN